MQRLTPVRRVTAILIAICSWSFPSSLTGGDASAATTTHTVCDQYGVCTTVTVRGPRLHGDGHRSPGSPGQPGHPGMPPPPPPDDLCAGMVGNDPTTADNPAACAAQLHSEACIARGTV